MDIGTAIVTATGIFALLAAIFRYFPGPDKKPSEAPSNRLNERVLQLESNHGHLVEKVEELKQLFKDTVDQLTEKIEEVRDLVVDLKKRKTR